MTDSYDPGPLAILLADAWRGGVPLGDIPGGLTPRAPADGYAVQNRLVDELGYAITGWKLGSGSENAKRRTGLSGPLVGQLLAPGAYASGDTLTSTGGRPFIAEFEIAFVFDDDLASDLEDEVLFSHVTAYTAFEICQSRFQDPAQVAVPATIADNANACAHMLGRPIDLARYDELVREIVVGVDDSEVARSLNGLDCVDPKAAFLDFIWHAREQKLALHRDQIVLTGTLTTPVTVVPGHRGLWARYFGEDICLLL